MAFSVSSTAEARKPAKPRCGETLAPRLCLIHHQRRVANYYRGLMSKPPLPYRYRAERQPNRRLFWLAYWTLHRKHAKQQYEQWKRQPWLHGPVYRALMCIHRYEGAWTDPDAPYWGGLQMDVSFMRTYNPGAYARWGTADRWPAAEQLEAGYRAVMVRGYSPWPTTRHMCGV